jgi:hypothetical protein
MMAKHEDLGPEQFGRRSSIKRFVYQASPESGDKGGQGRGRWRDERDWSAIKDQLRRTVRHAPEVVIKVKGSRRATDGDREAIAGVLRYMMYISRNGRLLATDEKGDRIDGREAIRDTHASWDLDMQRMLGRKGEALHPTFNIIFSMPAHTEAVRMLDAVQAFAREHFQGHQYLMALHTHETDPADDPPEHPHVHVVLRAESGDGQRIYIRKGTLRSWREAFAAELRARGVDANATSRAERGRSIKAKSGAEWHIDKRAKSGEGTPSRVIRARLQAAATDLEEGCTELKPWEIAMAARRRDLVRQLQENAGRLRQEGDAKLAADVDRFVNEMPTLDTERRQMQRALVRQVRDRLQGQDREIDDNSK